MRDDDKQGLDPGSSETPVGGPVPAQEETSPAESDSELARETVEETEDSALGAPDVPQRDSDDDSAETESDQVAS